MRPGSADSGFVHSDLWALIGWQVCGDWIRTGSAAYSLLRSVISKKRDVISIPERKKHPTKQSLISLYHMG